MSEEIEATKTYAFTFTALLILLGVTIGAAYINLGWFNTVIAVAIAAAKMTLIAMFFMHAKHAYRVTLIAVFAGLFWLGILFTLSYGDYFTRWTAPRPTVWLP